jgi:hypothetical protein
MTMGINKRREQRGAALPAASALRRLYLGQLRHLESPYNPLFIQHLHSIP